MRILLIRHGETPGNAKKRYVGGRTDEGISEEGRAQLQEIKAKRKTYPYAKVYISPMLRCKQTAEVFFGQETLEVVEDLRECDFGIFENKNYMELKEEPRYQEWIDSNATLPFPEGESLEGFQKRVVDAFLAIVEGTKEDIVFVVHGGTIMSIMYTLCDKRNSYFDWSVKNGCGFYVEYDKERKKIYVIEEVTG